MNRSRRASQLLALIFAAAAPLTAGCASAGQFVWIGDYQEPSGAAFKILPGDLIYVRVLNQDAVSGRQRVREDGKISLPFLNDVDAAGYAPSALAQQLQARFKDYFTLPVVSVAVEERKAISIPVVGEVAKPGVYPFDASPTVLQVLALSGGLTDFARRDRIFVLRNQPAPVRIRFEWRALSRAEGPAAAFRLQAGDAVVVE